MSRDAGVSAGSVQPLTLGELTSRAARRHPRRLALTTPDGSWTYAALSEEAEALGRGLVRAGLGPGDRAALLLPNSHHYFILYFAVPRAGGVTVPVNTFLAPAEVAAVIEDCEATLLVTTARRLAALGSRLARLRTLRTIVVVPGEEGAAPPLPRGVRLVSWEETREGGDAELPPPPGAEELAVLTYTSGTTGRMKGVMLSHANLVADARACLEAVRLGERDRLLLFLPMFHSLTQMVCIVTPALGGLPVILLPGVDRASIRAALRKFRPTIFVAVPAIYSTMADHAPGRIARWLNPVRLYISGGSPLPGTVLERFEKVWRRPLCEGYGLSEAGPVVSLNPPDGHRKHGSVGPSLPGVELRIRSEDGSAAPSDEVGEILVRGPNVMMGYHGKPEETAATLREGWLHTGDLGRLDTDGYLYIAGRRKEMLIFRGMNVYPREIEEVLSLHPGVAEAAVVGVEEGDKGEVPLAAVQLRRGASVGERELRRFCMERLARYKVPRTIIVLSELPRGATGKVLKDRVREEILASVNPKEVSPLEGKAIPGA
ncbi:MAG TPA: long-chain-fatty-acid--CoA ligase [Candidatus Saccharimonadales bacterium]|nr:long-chain-fatty-acid--CoA ligase [Candidatus Saccharimonadales bacterium]